MDILVLLCLSQKSASSSLYPGYPSGQLRRAGTRAIGPVPETAGYKSLDETEESENTHSYK